MSPNWLDYNTQGLQARLATCLQQWVGRFLRGPVFLFVETSAAMNSESSQLWRGVVTDTRSGRFVTEKIVRAVDSEDASEQLGGWFHGMDLAPGDDLTLISHRLVSRGPESLLGSRPRLWPVDTPASREPRSVPPSQRCWRELGIY